MLHDKRDKVLQIRLSDNEYYALQSFAYVNFNMKLSNFARILLLSYVSEVCKNEQNN